MSILKRVVCMICTLVLCVMICSVGYALSAASFEQQMFNVWFSLSMEEQNMIQTMIYYGVSTDRILQTYQKGDHGSDVLNLKNRLKELGYYSPTATFDDEFNSVMVERVKMFQKNQHPTSERQFNRCGLLILSIRGKIISMPILLADWIRFCIRTI